MKEINVITNETKMFLRVDDVANLLDISTQSAYKIMRKLNKELEANGYITVSGRISRQYFESKVYGSITA